MNISIVNCFKNKFFKYDKQLYIFVEIQSLLIQFFISLTLFYIKAN